jgi:hypothetical protein
MFHEKNRQQKQNAQWNVMKLNFVGGTNNRQTRNRLMITNRFLLVCGMLAGIAASTALVGCKSSHKGAASETGGASVGSEITQPQMQKVQFLFVQNAKDVSFKDGTMTLHGVNPVTVCFADRPERIAGHMPTSKIVPMWSEGTNSFTADPPNATLSILGGDKVSSTVVVLRNPRISGDDLTYDIRTLEGPTPSHGGACSLFIDIIGMPLTPYSYAGAARRAARWGYPGVYGPAVVPVAPVVYPHPYVVY